MKFYRKSLLLVVLLSNSAISNEISADIKTVEEPGWIYLFTVLGEDKDKDEIRDDIQNWIHANSREINTRRILISYARYSQKLLENTFAPDKKIIEIFEQRKKLQDCMGFIRVRGTYDHLTDPLNLEFKLVENIYNTPIRKLWRWFGEAVLPEDMLGWKSKPLEQMIASCPFQIAKINKYLDFWVTKRKDEIRLRNKKEELSVFYERMRREHGQD